MTGIAPLHRIWRALPAGARRRALAEVSARLAPPLGSDALAARGVAVLGELSRESGLGEVARLIIAGLETLAVPFWPLDIGTADRPRAVGATPPVGAALLLHVNAPVLPLALLRLPRDLTRGRRRIGYWAWELPTMPAAWRPAVRLVHEVWTLSRFSAAAIGRIAPVVRVVTPPVAARPPVPAALDRAAFGLPPDAVVALTSFSLASSFERKNPLGAITAFRAAFGDRPDRLLVLKVAHGGEAPADRARLREAVAGAPNIRVLDETLPTADSHAMTRACDIVLSLHRSEGFGLVPAEAMLLGRPVVATGWSGNLDFMDAECAALVPARLVPARDPRGVFEAPGAVWAEPDGDLAAAMLRGLADDAERRVALGARGQAAARARLGVESLRDALLASGIGAAPDSTGSARSARDEGDDGGLAEPDREL